MKSIIILSAFAALTISACSGGSGGSSSGDTATPDSSNSGNTPSGGTENGTKGKTENSSSGTENGTGGAEKPSTGATDEGEKPDETSPPETQLFNPFPNGNSEITEVVDLYSSIPWTGAVGAIRLDPRENKYEIHAGDEVFESGTYDPKTGFLTVKDCHGTNDPEFCKPGERSELFSGVGDYFGGNFVRVFDPKNSGTKIFLPRYYATAPTEDINMPRGEVIYKGEGVFYTDTYDPGKPIENHGDKGTAETRVNFDAGTLDASFGGFTGEFAGTSAELKSAKIEGNKFSGGDLNINRAGENLTFLSGDNEFYSFGGFYGPNGEEVGGDFHLDDALNKEGRFNTLYGAWYGVQQ